jgi:chaperonin GroEL
MDLKRGIDKAVEAIVADLAKQAKVVEATLKKLSKSLLFLITMKL